MRGGKKKELKKNQMRKDKNRNIGRKHEEIRNKGNEGKICTSP